LREVLRGRPELVRAVAAAGLHGVPVDVDTPEDYAGLVEPSSGAP
jgi:CTP:molybdopterin cytidylyltransferase MocA